MFSSFSAKYKDSLIVILFGLALSFPFIVDALEVVDPTSQFEVDQWMLHETDQGLSWVEQQVEAIKEILDKQWKTHVDAKAVRGFGRVVDQQLESTSSDSIIHDQIDKTKLEANKLIDAITTKQTQGPIRVIFSDINSDRVIKDYLVKNNPEMISEWKPLG